MINSTDVNKYYTKINNLITDDIELIVANNTPNIGFPTTFRIVDSYIQFNSPETATNGLSLTDTFTNQQGEITSGHIYLVSLIVPSMTSIGAIINIGLSSTQGGSIGKVILSNQLLDNLDSNTGINIIPDITDPFIVDGINKYMTIDLISGNITSGTLRIVWTII